MINCVDGEIREWCVVKYVAVDIIGYNGIQRRIAAGNNSKRSLDDALGRVPTCEPALRAKVVKLGKYCGAGVLAIGLEVK